MRAAMGVETYHARLAGSPRSQQAIGAGQVQYLAAVSDNEDEPAVMGGLEPFSYYGTERSASPAG